LSGFGDFIYGCMLILWHVYFGDVWFISAATVDESYKCMLYDICWRRNVYFLNKCFIRVFYRFNRSRVLHWSLPMLWKQRLRRIWTRILKWHTLTTRLASCHEVSFLKKSSSKLSVLIWFFSWKLGLKSLIKKS